MTTKQPSHIPASTGNSLAGLAAVAVSLMLGLSANASPLTHYYTYQPVEGVPQPQTSFALGTDWTLNLSQSPDALYSQNTGFNAGTSYRTLYGDGNNLVFKFNRQPGDTNVYDVKVNLSGYNQWSGNGSPSMTLLWGTDAFGFNDNDTANHGRVWWSSDTADLTQVASSTADGGFTWDSGNVATFRIAANQQSAYLVVLGSANSYGYVYSASADFTVVPVPAIPSTLTEYYQNQPVEGVPQPQTSFALGTDWALTLSPDSLYAQNTGFNAGTSYRTLYGDGNNLLFKFNRQPGDTNAYDVTVNLSGFNQPSSDGTPPIIRLLWGTDAFGINDNDTANRGRVWWTADTANLTQVASNTGNGGFTWNSGNVSNFRIGEDQQSAYLMVLGSVSSYAYVYSASADFTAIPTGYAPWAATYAGGQTIDLDYDNDGVSNGVEYFMNAAPGFTANPGLVGNTVSWPNGGNIRSSAYGTQFVVQTSSDLVTWDDVTEGDMDQNGTNTASSLSYTLDPANNPAKQFVRLKVMSAGQ
jgi:hypothetical protein